MKEINGPSEKAPTSPAEFRSCFLSVMNRFDAKIKKSETSSHLGHPRLWLESADVYRGLRGFFERRQDERRAGEVEVFAERELYSKDKLLFGTIDAYFVRPEGIDLVDYKTSALFENEVPREKYVSQLYFYAYLIEENFGIYPKRLSLVGKDGQLVDVEPSRSESSSMAEKMRAMLNEYNSIVADPTQGIPARPSESSCLYCDLKVKCGHFMEALSSMNFPDWHHVAIGSQSSLTTSSKNGVARIELDVETSSLNTGSLVVSRVLQERFPDLEDKVGQRLVITNLKTAREGDASIVSATKRTVIARLEPQ